MENTKNGEADCPACGESAGGQRAPESALKRAARELEESTIILPYGQEATAKLPPNLVSRTMLQSLERELARSGVDRQAFSEQPAPAMPQFMEPSFSRDDHSARFGQMQESPGTLSNQELTRAMGVNHGPETGPTAPRATWHTNPLRSMLTPKPPQHFRLAMTPGAGLQVQPVHTSVGKLVGSPSATELTQVHVGDNRAGALTSTVYARLARLQMQLAYHEARAGVQKLYWIMMSSGAPTRLDSGWYNTTALGDGGSNENWGKQQNDNDSDWVEDWVFPSRKETKEKWDRVRDSYPREWEDAHKKNRDCVDGAYQEFDDCVIAAWKKAGRNAAMAAVIGALVGAVAAKSVEGALGAAIVAALAFGLWTLGEELIECGEALAKSLKACQKTTDQELDDLWGRVHGK